MENSAVSGDDEPQTQNTSSGSAHSHLLDALQKSSEVSKMSPISESSSRPKASPFQQKLAFDCAVYNAYKDLPHISSAPFLVSRDREFTKDFACMLHDEHIEVRPGERSSPSTTHDAILGVVIPVLKQHKVKSFNHFCADMRVAAATNSALTFKGNISQPKMYTFLEYGYVGRTVPLRLTVTGCGPCPTSTVSVLIAGEWIDLKAWLDLLPPSRCGSDGTDLGDQGYELQFRWWSTNGKTFRLMDLPRELRDIFFTHMLGSTIFPYPTIPINDNSVLTFGTGVPYPFLPAEEQQVQLRKPVIEILRLNRQVHMEALEAGWKYTVKRFDEPGHLKKAVEYAPKLPFDALRHIELRFSQWQYMNFFAMDVPRLEDQDVYWGEANVLRQIPTLKSLSLHFPSTKYCCEWSPWAGDSGWPRRTACQKIVVDWILSFAKPYIEHIPEIELAGYIKHSTRQKWEKIFEDQKRGFRHEVDLAAITSLPADSFPPKCSCTEPCHFQAYEDILLGRHNYECGCNGEGDSDADDYDDDEAWPCPSCKAWVPRYSEDEEKEIMASYKFSFDD